MNDAQKLLSAIHDLAPAICARSAEIEAARELPADLIHDLTAAGCFRMFVPRSHGGLELDLTSSLEIFEALARADGSAGWTVMIGAEAVLLLALLPRKRFDALYFGADRAKILDTWFVSGLNGTGSNDIVVERIQVPDDDTFDRFFGQPSIPGPLYIAATSQFSLHDASVGIGIAQHAIDDVIALASNQKRRIFAQFALAETPVFQHNLARAELSLRAARAVVTNEAESFWAKLSSGKVPDPAEQVQPSVT